MPCAKKQDIPTMPKALSNLDIREQYWGQPSVWLSNLTFAHSMQRDLPSVH